MPRHRLLVSLATLALLSACDKPYATVDPIAPDPVLARNLVRFPDCLGPATSVASAFDVTLPLETYLRNHELFAALAKELPGGFAGVFFDKDKPVLMLRNPSQQAEAKAAIAPYLANLYSFDLAAAEVRQARWDFAQLSNWHTYLFRHTALPMTPGLTYHDTDVSLNRILLGAEDAAARDRLRAVLSTIDLPCDVIFLEIRPATG